MIIEVETRLWIRETVVSPLPLEPGISWVFSCLYSLEEGFERKIDAHLDILQYLRIDWIQFRVVLLPMCQDFVSIIV
jgi:hypothetical protein